jgi:ParB family chromosome partitioning protein
MQKGLLQSIIVRIIEEGEADAEEEEQCFQVVAGNRRLQACKALRWRKIACHLVELSDKEAFEVSLIENMQRKSLSPIEEAHSFNAYIREFRWGGISDLARKTGKSVSYINKRIRLLDLPSDVLEQISSSTMTVSNAEELMSIQDANKQRELASIICQNRLSHRETCDIVKNHENFMFERPSHTIIFSGNRAALEENSRRSFDKSIITLKIALRRLASIMESMDDIDSWIVNEILMEHRSMLNAQIDAPDKGKEEGNETR